MPTEVDPIELSWYAHLDKGQRFRVVSVDEEKGLVEIQNFDGQIDEIELDDWYQMDIETSEAPENWSGASDIDNPDDYGTEITDTVADDWDEPYKEIRDSTLETEDEWEEGSPEEEPLEK